MGCGIILLVLIVCWGNLGLMLRVIGMMGRFICCCFSGWWMRLFLGGILVGGMSCLRMWRSISLLVR